MNTETPKALRESSYLQKPEQLKRRLSNRHIQLIAISGAIGSGLFLGAGKTIHAAGPSIVLVYMLIGFFLFFLMRAMGELLLSNLNYRSFADFASDLLGPWAGFFVGWSYWFCWVVIATADVIVIVGKYLPFWFPELSPWLPALFLIMLFLGLNLLSVKLYGETEFWFSMIKIITIFILVGVGLFLIATSFKSVVIPPFDSFSNMKIYIVEASVSNIWSHGGIFPNGWGGFFAGFQLAIFSFVGLELVGTTAAEAKDPYTTLPRAINSIPFRIIFFYVFALLAIICVTPWNLINPSQSPFVEMFKLVGLATAAGMVNFVVMTSAASSANGGIYSTSRMLYGLAQSGVAPRMFGRLSRYSVPASALVFSCICITIGSAIVLVAEDAMTAFVIVTSVATVLFLFIWSVILASYIVYHKKSPEKHVASKYKMPGGVFMAWLTAAFFLFALVLLLFDDETRLALFITPVWFLILGFAYWRIKCKIRRKIAEHHQC